jgi:hypothetical protein
VSSTRAFPARGCLIHQPEHEAFSEDRKGLLDAG